MDMEKIAVFRMTTGKMQWLAERQRILAENIANSDTPKYRPSDLTPVDFRKVVKRLHTMHLARTNPMHVTLGREDHKFETVKEKTPYETSPDGNAVVLEEQMVKTAQTTQDYELMTSLYAKNMNMFRIALGHGSSK